MALTSDQITAQNFADFYQMILPYLNGGGVGLKLLWENSDPSQGFGAQNIELSSSDYDLLLFIGRAYITSAQSISTIAPKGTSAVFICNAGGDLHGCQRNFTRTNDTEYAVSDAMETSGSGTATTNSRAIPYRIYGLKVYNRDVPSTQIVKTGTTMADLISAIDALTEWQKNNCIIKITYSGSDLYMRRKMNNRYATGYVAASNNNGTVREYYLETAQSKFSYVISTGTTTVDQGSLSFTSWELYYQG